MTRHLADALIQINESGSWNVLTSLNKVWYKDESSLTQVNGLMTIWKYVFTVYYV